MARGTYNRRHKGGVLRKKFRRNQVQAKRARLKRRGVGRATIKRRIKRTRARQMGTMPRKVRRPSSRTPGRRRRRGMR